MIIELVLALIIGICAGTITGLFPGIHINTVAAGLLALVSGGYFLGIPANVLVVFIVAMAITHTFLDFIPSVFLGAPDDETYLAVLPGHELLKQGRGYEAVVFTLYGCLAALPIIFLFSFLFANFLSPVYIFLRTFIPFILIFASLYLILREDNFLASLIIFLSAGVLGLLTFNLPVKEPLLPLLTGLFGVSGLILSIKDEVKIPRQEVKSLREIKLDKSYWKTFFIGGIVAPLFSFFPAIGSGQAAVIASEASGKKDNDPKSFLFLVGMINVIVMALSFVTLYAIEKSRTGAAVAVNEVLGKINASNLVLIIVIIFVSGIFSFVIGTNIGRLFAKNVIKVNYRKLSYFILAILFVINILLTNFIGLIVLIAASALGVFCVLCGARRINLMGALLLSTIVYYLLQ
jgi:putative membrane protein